MKLLLILWFLNAGPGDSLTLPVVQQQVLSNYPLQRQKEVIKSNSVLRVNNLQTAHLPQLSLNGQATYQSDVIKIDIPLPRYNFPTLRRDHYLLTADLSQILFDGGAVAGQVRMENAQQEADRQQLEVELNKLKAQVNQLYFSILLLKEKEKILLSVQDQLKARQKAVASAVKNGVQPETNLFSLQAEYLKTDQQLAETRNDRIASIRLLGELMGTELDSGVRLTIPGSEIIPSNTTRPEYQLFELQKKRIDAADLFLRSKRLPKIAAFGQAGYGYPTPFNPFATSFQSFYIVGMKLNWNVWDWNSTHRDLEQIKLNRTSIEIQKQVFDKNLRLALRKDSTDMDKMNEILKKDQEIMVLRGRILKASNSQLENGVLLPADYISDLNAEAQSRLNFRVHMLQLRQTEIDLMTQLGKL